MIEITSGYELTTSITNIFILIFSIFGYVEIKDKRWNFFFLCMILDSFIGTIVHGIDMSELVYNLLWVFLAICFTMTINTLLGIYLNLKIRHIVYLSIIITFLIFIEMLFEIDFIFTFSMYVLLVLIICLYKIIKSSIIDNIWFLMGFLFEIIGGIFMLSKIKMSIINHNGIYHIFTVIALLCFYIGVNKNDYKSSRSINRKRR